MKVCHLIDHLGLGGAQKLLVDLLETRSEHFRPHVIALRDKSLDTLVKRIRDCGGHYRTLSLNHWYPIGLLSLRTALRDGDFDLLHTHLEYSNSFGVAAAAMLGRQKPRIVRHIHADPSLHNSSLFHAFARATARFVDAHVAVSPGVAVKTASMLGCSEESVNIIQPGIDLLGLENTTADSGRIRSLRAGAKRVVGFVGRLAEQKNIEILIDTMPALLAADPTTRLLIVGDGPLKTALIEKCRQAGLTNSVEFTGYLEHVSDAYRAMDVLAYSTRYEGLPLTLIEAMAMRVPVVASAATGVIDIVSDEVTGLLATPSDIQSMSTSILRLFDEPTLTKSIQEAAYDRVHAHYSRQRMTAETEALYAELQSGAN